MRNRQLRDYLAALIVASAPVLVAGCSDSSPDTEKCDPDMNPRDGSVVFVTRTPTGSLDCQTFCATQLEMTGQVAGDLSECQVDPYTLPDDGGTSAQVTCPIVTFGCGRGSAGVLPAPSSVQARDEVGEYLARAAHLEATSVVAFERLAQELEAHEAPNALIERARRAADDERRHARALEGLARARGAAVPALEVLPFEVRTLALLADENVIEGVVGETFGAALALHQAAHAEERALARAMSRIARDEVAHAGLAWAVDRWARRRLPAAAGELDARRGSVVERLSQGRSPSPRARRILGLPSDSARSFLIRRLRADLWRPR